MKKIFFFALTAITLTACDQNDDNPTFSQVAAEISATIGEGGSTRAKDTSWETGDRIGVTSTFGEKIGPFINMEYANEDGSSTFKGNPLYYYNPMTLTAYYPFEGPEDVTPGNGGVIERSTGVDNQTSDNQPKIDFLYAGKTEIAIEENKPVINFTFEHKMSKLSLKFIKGNDGIDVGKIISYRIDGLILEGTFNTLTGACAAKADAAPESLTINLPEGAVKNEEFVPSLIIFPQSTEDKTVKLTITDSDNQVYACNLSFGNDGIQSGNSYEYSITVSKAGLTVNKPNIIGWTSKEDTFKADSE